MHSVMSLQSGDHHFQGSNVREEICIDSFLLRRASILILLCCVILKYMLLKHSMYVLCTTLFSQLILNLCIDLKFKYFAADYHNVRES